MKGDTIMKSMRYLLIVMMLSVASVMFAAAQNLAQQPQAEMKSTSGMMYSGSTLPSAAASGAVTTGSKLGTYNPAGTATEGPSGRRKIGGSGSGTGGNEAEENENPYETPLGDAGWALMLLALAYMGVRAFLKRKRA